MNTLSSLASSRFLPQKMNDVLAAANHFTQADLPKLQSPGRASNDDVVTLSDAGVALAKRANDLGNATIDMAQSLISNFASQLFGDAAKDMKISFDNASISAMAGFSATVEHNSGVNGSSDAASLSVQEASDFIGKGQITTADGHVYNFEVEVHYQAIAEASASSWTRNANNPGIENDADTPGNAHAQSHRQSHGDADQASAMASLARRDLSAHFPGSMKELFSLLDGGKLTMGFHLPATGVDNQPSRNGSLTLHLLDLLKAPNAQSKKRNDAYLDDVEANSAKLETTAAAVGAVANGAVNPRSAQAA
jgi:hypothetical protein